MLPQMRPQMLLLFANDPTNAPANAPANASASAPAHALATFPANAPANAPEMHSQMLLQMHFDGLGSIQRPINLRAPALLYGVKHQAAVLPCQIA